MDLYSLPSPFRSPSMASEITLIPSVPMHWVCNGLFGVESFGVEPSSAFTAKFTRECSWYGGGITKVGVGDGIGIAIDGDNVDDVWLLSTFGVCISIM